MTINDILALIDMGNMALPEFQRGYVWNRDQVRGLMHSLYHRHPVGSLLIWVTRTEDAPVRQPGELTPGTVKLLLDGQQRITSLYGIIRGHPPRFFDGNPDAFTNLYFNLDEESFEFYAPLKMKDNPRWVSVTELMQQGVAPAISKVHALPELVGNFGTYINRINAVHGIKDIQLHGEEVTGPDKTIDVVVDIFNRVNSGGTKLSRGDLALAKVCAGWPEARQQMKKRLENWARVGLYFDLDWLLRNITTVLTGQAMFSGLDNVGPSQIQAGLDQTEKACNYLFNLVSARLGLDHDRVLGSRYAFPVMSRYVALHGGKLTSAREQDKLLYWYIHTMLWGRFASATETFMNQDLRQIDGDHDALDRLIEQLRRSRGDLHVRSEDFGGSTLGARFYPMLYLLTRVCGARDWGYGWPLSANMLGKLNALQVHHIFPKAYLSKAGYPRNEINAIANYCFLAQTSNLDISDTPPRIYFEQVERDHPGALASQWIPMDRELWRAENYRDFLQARRELLAAAANSFLNGLLAGSTAETQVATPVLERPAASIPGGIASEDEERLLRDIHDWIVSQGLPSGMSSYELVDEETGEPLAILDLAWPRGLQEGLSQPVTLLIGEGRETEEAANRAGFRFFTEVEEFRKHVLSEILVTEAA